MLRSDFFVRWLIVLQVLAAQREPPPLPRSRRCQSIVSSEEAVVKTLDGMGEGGGEGDSGFVWVVQLAGLSQ